MTIYTGTDSDDDFIVGAPVPPGDEYYGFGGQDTLILGSTPAAFYNFLSTVLDSIEDVEFINGVGTAAGAFFNFASHPFVNPANTITGSAGFNTVTFITSIGGDFTMPEVALIDWDFHPAEFLGLASQSTSAVTLRANEAVDDNVVQSLTGGNGNDTLIGHSGVDVLGGGGGTDIMLALAGDDVIRLANYGTDLDQSTDTADGGIGEDITLVIGPVIAGTLSSVEHIQFFAASSPAGPSELILSTSRNGLFLATANFVGTISGTVTLNFDTVDVFDGSGITFDDQVFNGTLVASNLEVAFNFNGNDNANTIIGTSRGDTFHGGGGLDILIGGSGQDTFYGEAGMDYLYGGADGDNYHVDSQMDLIFENAGDSLGDRVFSSASHYLYQNVEELYLQAGSGDLFGVGNAGNNTIYGNEGSNLLIGGAGHDYLLGGDGIDSIFGEDGNDEILGDAGIDYLVGGAGDDAILGGLDADALYGEDGNDTLTGGEGFFTDILVGGAGNDTLYANSNENDYDQIDGGSGDDTYYVDTGDDLTFEAEDGGTDTVYADVSNVPNAGVYLYANVENLFLEGSTAFGVGNELNNQLTGSASGNWLLGGAGNDTINGKAGDDVLFGEAGGDTFVFQTNSGADVIGDFNGAEDQINLEAYDFASFEILQANFHQVGSDGAIDLGGGNLIVLHGVTMANLNAGDFVL